MDFLLVIAGLVLLFYGGEFLVKGSIGIAKKLGLSSLLIGVVVVGFGTSTPELMVSVDAAMTGHMEIALGNVIGSNTANILLILGFAALLCPIVCREASIFRDSVMVVAASVLMAILTFVGIMPRILGVAMILTLMAYILYCYRAERAANKDKETEEDAEGKMDLKIAIPMVIGSLIALIFGADLLVKGATNLARAAGISEAVIGLTLVAVGTSLPELAAAISAAIKKNSDIVIGNILGSNMFNILFILGVTSTIKPIPITGQIADVDIFISLAVAIATAAVIFLTKQISRPAGGIMLAVYIGYTAWLFLQTPAAIAG